MTKRTKRWAIRQAARTTATLTTGALFISALCNRATRELVERLEQA